MIALDTNILARFLVRDDEKQAKLVYARFKQAESARETLYVPLLVVLELLWVLESAYNKSNREILNALSDLRMMPILEFENDEVIQALIAEGVNSDLPDLLIALAARSSGCTAVITFDRKASKLPLFQLLA